MKSALPVILTLFFIVRPLPAQYAVAIQPLGKVDSVILSAASSGMERLYNLKVEILPTVPLPRSAYYQPRQRYRADKLLDFLDSIRNERYLKIVGLTSADISTTKGEFYDWGIFGLGSLGGPSCVVSTYRLKSGRINRKKFLERLVKVVNHELGHAFGLDHCPHKGCLMEDAAGTIKTVDREDGRLCPRCRERLGSLAK